MKNENECCGCTQTDIAKLMLRDRIVLCWDCVFTCRVCGGKGCDKDFFVYSNICYNCDFRCEVCNKAGNDKRFFSYSNVCWDCDEDSQPTNNQERCNMCHRVAREYYDGLWYCDFCI